MTQPQLTTNQQLRKETGAYAGLLAPRRRARRNGLVLREVVVLIILPLILLNVMFPALHRVREAASRMTCTNNLKQQALACHNFASDFNYLPPGYSQQLATPMSEIKEDDYGYSWAAHLLPYAEQQAIYDVLKATGPDRFVTNFSNKEGLGALQFPVSTFRCPSDRAAPVLNIGRDFEKFDGLAISLSNYVANNGSGDVVRGAQSDRSNGIFWANSHLTLSAIVDGTSNTVMIGERAWERGYGKKSHPRAALLLSVRSLRDRSYFGMADAMAAGRFRINFDAVQQADGLGESYIRRGFSSNHPGGSSFALADGAVRFIRTTVDADMDPVTQCTRTPEVDSFWEKILSRDDGLTLDEEL